MKKIIFAILLLPIVTLAQAGDITVGENTVSYDSSNKTEAGTLYYQGENLVVSEHTGLTLVYENDEVILEAHDTNGDGELDTFLVIDSNDEISNITGEGASTFERSEVVEFGELLANEGGSDATAYDLVGSLDSIKIPGQGMPWGMIIVVLIAAGVGYRYYQKRKFAEKELE